MCFGGEICGLAVKYQMQKESSVLLQLLTQYLIGNISVCWYFKCVFIFYFFQSSVFKIQAVLQEQMASSVVVVAGLL